MKKEGLKMRTLVCVVLACVVCSCGNDSKQQTDLLSVKDPITRAVKDSLERMVAAKEYEKIHSREFIENNLKFFLLEYINSVNDDINNYLSTDFKAVIKEWSSMPNMAEWNLFGLNSSATVERYTIKNLETGDNEAKAFVELSIDNEGDYEKETSTINLVCENDKWVVDEIDDVKKNMKHIIKEGGEF